MDSVRSSRGLKIAVAALGIVAVGLTVALVLVASSGSSDDADSRDSATRKAPCAIYLTSNDGDPETRDGYYDPDVTASGTLLPMDDPNVPADTSNCAVITERESGSASP